MREFLQKHRFYFQLALVILLATILRFNQLGQVPHGFAWDEAAIGYNGFAIWNTRRDEWLMRLPISFRSFGDYKAPLAIYLNSIFTAVFGLNVWAVRLPFALFSLVAVGGMGLLAREVFKSERWGIITAVLMTLSPWHLHYSRVGFESGIALAMIIWAIWFLLKFHQQKKWWWLSLSSLVAGVSLYAYHSAKITVPLLFLALIWPQRKMLIKKWKLSATMLLLVILIASPLIYDSFFAEGLTRAGTIILTQVPVITWPGVLLKQFGAHLSPAFLVDGWTTTLRHGDGRWGVLLPTTFIFSLTGLVLGWKKREKDSVWVMSLWLIGLGLLPAALGEEIPHSNRALLALPGFLLLASLGLKNSLELIKKSALNEKFKGTKKEPNILLYTVVSLVVTFHGLYFISYLNDYYSHFTEQSAADFKDGYLEAFAYVAEREDQVEKILFTSDYGQPYIYALFVRQTNPIWYNGGSLIKYEFTDEIDVGDLVRENTIVVASQEDEMEAGWADKLILGSDGSVRFKIYLPKEK